MKMENKVDMQKSAHVGYGLFKNEPVKKCCLSMYCGVKRQHNLEKPKGICAACHGI